VELPHDSEGWILCQPQGTVVCFHNNPQVIELSFCQGMASNPLTFCCWNSSLLELVYVTISDPPHNLP
jgi:hypothetical protein